MDTLSLVHTVSLIETVPLIVTLSILTRHFVIGDCGIHGHFVIDAYCNTERDCAINCYFVNLD